MTFKKMGCKATNLNVRPRFLLSHIKRNTPLLKEVWNIFEHNMFELKQGNYKDILKTSVYSYAIEVHEYIQKFRKKRLYSKLATVKDLNVVIPESVEYVNLDNNRLLSISKMESFDTDLFDYLDEDNMINIPNFVGQMSSTMDKIHRAGIYCIDFKPENILLNVNDQKFFITDIDNALMKHDFASRHILRRQKWVRTECYEPGLGKPCNEIEAIRTDLYGLSLTIGRIESHYKYGKSYNVFLYPRNGIIDDKFDDRSSIPLDMLLSRFCANFMVRDLMYKERIVNYHKNILELI